MRVDTSSGRGRAKDSRLVVIGGVVAVLALLLVLLGGGLSTDEFLTAGFMSLRDGVMRALPEGTPPADRNRLHRAFACVIAGAGSHAVSEARLGAFAKACRLALADGRVDLDEVRALAEAGEELCRRSAGGGV